MLKVATGVLFPNYKDGKCLTYRSNAVLKGDNTNRTEGNAVRCVKEK
jgi:hypothetical protein